jgi:predicted DNA-binding transcriptional regulator YafY
MPNLLPGNSADVSSAVNKTGSPALSLGRAGLEALEEAIRRKTAGIGYDALEKKRNTNKKRISPEKPGESGKTDEARQESGQEMIINDADEPEEEALGRKSLNGTAYRIFKLLQWLIGSPLSLDELNARFRADPRIGRGVSSDSVWLYVNTLKALGCRVRRPSPRNGFCYEMISHPFGLTLSEERQETLAMAKAHAQRSFSHQDMLVLDRLLKKIIRHSNVSSPQDSIDVLFRQSRSFDMEAIREHIRVLEDGLAEEALFRVRYRSPLQGEESFVFLPELLYYEQGVVYVRGDRSDLPGPSSLRVDRIAALQELESEAVRMAIRERRLHKIEVRLRLFVPEPESWPGLGLDKRHGVYGENRIYVNRTGRLFVETLLQVRDFFYLQQRLLAGGHAFQILSPEGFRDSVRQTLESMLRFYTEPTEEPPIPVDGEERDDGEDVISGERADGDDDE